MPKGGEDIVSDIEREWVVVGQDDAHIAMRKPIRRPGRARRTLGCLKRCACPWST